MKPLVFFAVGAVLGGWPAEPMGSAPVAGAASETSTVGVAPTKSWTFIVSGDSRNCGDVIMPVISRAATERRGRFYWHLGDLRAMYEIDEDYAGLHGMDIERLKLNLYPPAELTNYQNAAWGDFLDNQLKLFKVPFFLGIGNHETIGRTLNDFVTFFHDQLNIPPIQKQRELDKPGDTTVRTYFHWREGSIDFIYLDNSTSEFDADQLSWFNGLMDKMDADTSVRTLVVGMHESLPYSYSASHSMNQANDNGSSGVAVYNRLLAFRKKDKPVYVLSSHSHYFLADAYNTAHWQSKGGVLRGVVIGTAGAQHYSIPQEVKEFTQYAENQYGYVVATVSADPKAKDPLSFRFVPIKKAEILPSVIHRYGNQAVNFCFSQNWSASVAGTN